MRQIKLADMLLMAALLTVGGLLYVFLYIGDRDSGPTYALVTVDGQEYGRYALNQNDSIRISQGNGVENRVVIKDGRVWMKSASCPDRLCVKQGKKHRVGESVVCLPNRVVITIEGEDREIDTIAQ